MTIDSPITWQLDSPVQIAPRGPQDGVLLKTNAAGVEEWRVQAGGEGVIDSIVAAGDNLDGAIVAIAHDGESNLLLLPTGDSIPLPSAAGIELVSLNHRGELRWRSSIECEDISADVLEFDSFSETIVLAGRLGARAILGREGELQGDLSPLGTADSDSFVARYSARGPLQWARSLRASDAFRISSVAIHTSGIAVMTSGRGEIADLGTGGIEPSNAALTTGEAGDRAWVIMLDLLGKTQWTARLASPDISSTQLAFDPNGSLYALANFTGRVDFDLGSQVPAPIPSRINGGEFTTNMLIAAFRADGALRWARGSLTNEGETLAADLVAASEGLTLIGYTSHATTLSAGEEDARELQVGDGLAEAFAYKASYALDGSLLDARFFSSSSAFVRPQTLVLSPNGQVYAAGQWSGSPSLHLGGGQSPVELASAGGVETFILLFGD